MRVAIDLDEDVLKEMQRIADFGTESWDNRDIELLMKAEKNLGIQHANEGSNDELEFEDYDG